jgi:hypothetical protein
MYALLMRGAGIHVQPKFNTQGRQLAQKLRRELDSKILGAQYSYNERRRSVAQAETFEKLPMRPQLIDNETQCLFEILLARIKHFTSQQWRGPIAPQNRSDPAFKVGAALMRSEMISALTVRCGLTICYTAARTTRTTFGSKASMNIKHRPKSAFLPKSSKTFCPSGVISTSCVARASW